MRRARTPLRALLCLLALLGSWAFLGRAGGLTDTRTAPMPGMAMAGAHREHHQGEAPSDAHQHGAHCPLCFLGGLDLGTPPTPAIRNGLEVVRPAAQRALDAPTAPPSTVQARAPPLG